MKNKTITISLPPRCINCDSEDHLEFSDDRTFAECTFCGATYPDGEEGIREKMLELPEVRKELEKAARKEAEKLIKQAFKQFKF